MRALVLALIALSVFVTGGVDAGAHNTTWYWSEYTANQTIRREGLDWRSGWEQVDYVRCTGTGDSIPSKKNRYRKLYRHFNCYIEARFEDPYWIKFHVTGRTRFAFTWLYWDR